MSKFFVFFLFEKKCLLVNIIIIIIIIIIIMIQLIYVAHIQRHYTLYNVVHRSK